jgi:hypothetical protein
VHLPVVPDQTTIQRRYRPSLHPARIISWPNKLLLPEWAPRGQDADRAACRCWILCLVVTWPAGMQVRVCRARRTAQHSPEPSNRLQQPRYGSQMHRLRH